MSVLSKPESTRRTFTLGSDKKHHHRAEVTITEGVENAVIESVAEDY